MALERMSAGRSRNPNNRNRLLQDLDRAFRDGMLDEAGLLRRRFAATVSALCAFADNNVATVVRKASISPRAICMRSTVANGCPRLVGTRDCKNPTNQSRAASTTPR
jgi:hypothetical protein